MIWPWTTPLDAREKTNKTNLNDQNYVRQEEISVSKIKDLQNLVQILDDSEILGIWNKNNTAK